MTNSNETISGYKLASIYKPLGLQPVRYILDQDKKSPAPILSMRKNDYFMVGKTYNLFTAFNILQLINFVRKCIVLHQEERLMRIEFCGYQ